MEIIGQVTERIKSGAQFLIRHSVRVIAAFSWSRRALNGVYLELSPSQRALFHSHYAMLFRNDYIQRRGGNWQVVFARKSILMPLTSEHFCLDWESALSIVGHDIEVQQTYEAIIGSSSKKPDLFIDIGANYGTHSLLFLVHGIRTMTFEPNSSCHDYFMKICKLNHVTPTLESVALGASQGFVELVYPRRDTGLGSTNSDSINKLSQSQDQELVMEKVAQKALDDYLPKIEHNRTLIKIDTEGNELAVLGGATKTMQEVQPMIIFECWPWSSKERTKIFDYFSSKNYSVYHLPWTPEYKAESLTSDQFLTSSSTNFIAVPIS
jgi:FkbM family methyltransferase